MNKIVFITGATSGFGEACAHVFAQHDYRLILNGRRTDRLQELQKTLEERYNASSRLLPFDVRSQQAVNEAFNSLPDEWKEVDVLVNNAGLALGRDLFDEARTEDWDIMLDTNVKGLLYVSKAAIPHMIRRKRGHIINLGSIAGKEAYERGNVYCASKAAVDSISRGMRIDLLQHNIKVTAIHPGAAETEFSVVRFKGSEDKAKKVYEGYTPLYATDVANIIYYTASLPAHVCINDLVVTPTAQANSYHVHRTS